MVLDHTTGYMQIITNIISPKIVNILRMKMFTIFGESIGLCFIETLYGNRNFYIHRPIPS
jgi:hypothetical protein